MVGLYIMVSVKGTGVGYYLIIVLLSFVLSCPLPLFSSDWSIIAGVSLFLFQSLLPLTTSYWCIRIAQTLKTIY